MDPALPLRRAAVVRIYDVLDRTVLIALDGTRHELAGDSCTLARATLSLLEHPHTRTELLGELESLTGGPIDHPEVVDELLALLLHTGAIEPAAAPPARRGPGPRVLLCITGAVASMHTPALVQRLQAHGLEVRIAATDEALAFVRVEALAALIHRPVVHGLWPADERHVVPHVELAAWADLVLVAPASATTLARIAAGDFSSVVSAAALTTRAPVLLVPSMNVAMYESPAVQRNLERLIADGYHVAHPARGAEVADRPDERTPVLGGAPPPEVVVQLAVALLRARAGQLQPRDEAGWDRLYRSSEPAALPWPTETPDPDLLAALDGPACDVLEIGAGLGDLAVAAARRGHRVVATELSAVALEHARARAPDAPVVWLQDDITDSRLHARFTRVLDRGCLHLLGPESAPRYAATLARLTAPGGLLVVKTLADPVPGVTPRDAAAMTALFAPAFTLERDAASTLPGPQRAPAARLYVLRRVG